MGEIRGGCFRSDDAASTIAVVDDDESMREALNSLLRSVGYACTVFPSAEAFLAAGQLATTQCMILDVRMPGLSGLELQARLRQMKSPVPIIFITAHGDDKLGRTVLREGASAFFYKPFAGEALLDAIRAALDSRRARYRRGSRPPEANGSRGAPGAAASSTPAQ
jgi:FixJ family two-component response regulator